MSKVVLGKRPKSFSPIKVSVAMPEGDIGEIEVTYKYRTRKQYGEFFDKLFADAGMDPSLLPKPAEQPEANSDTALDAPEAEIRFSLIQMLDKLIDRNASVIMDAVNGWDLPHDFTQENVEQLCDELPGLALAIIERYRQACVEGRLGN